MRRLHLVVLLSLFVVNAAAAKEVWLSIGGSTGDGVSVGSFRTDARIFNPSGTKDIQIKAYYLPAGNGDNSGVQPITITVPKRQMLVYDNVVTSLFHGSALGAIRLVSDDDFIATQRIYAVAPNSGSLGQFVGGVDATAAKAKGVIIQLKASGGNGQAGTFRTNVGAVNPNATAATVTWHLYDKSNAIVGTAKTMTIQPFGVIAPGGLAGYADDVPGNVDLSDAWISYESDKPIVAYGSVIDNGTSDPTYVPASEDTGSTPSPSGSNNAYNVVTRSFAIDFTPGIPDGTLNPGDTMTLHVTGRDTTHGFRLQDPRGRTLIDLVVNPGDQYDRTVTFNQEGTYTYYCTVTTCDHGTGQHNSMIGSFNVGQPTTPTPPPYGGYAAHSHH